MRYGLWKITAGTLFALFLLSCTASAKPNYAQLRRQMVAQQIVARGIEDKAVIKAMKLVPRHLFVPGKYRAHAYGDYPLPIGEGQTISQPYIVAFMTQALNLTPSDKVLEIGTGSGYQAAILAEIVKEVYTIEIIEPLGRKAQQLLSTLGYKNVFVRLGDGYRGWPEKAPFDAIIVTCAPEDIPGPLVEQLAEGGRLIIPVGKRNHIQKLVLGIKRNGKLEASVLLPVRFVPMLRGEN